MVRDLSLFDDIIPTVESPDVVEEHLNGQEDKTYRSAL